MEVFMLKDFPAWPELFVPSFRPFRRPKGPPLVLNVLLAVAAILLVSGCAQPQSPEDADMDRVDIPDAGKEAVGGDDPVSPDGAGPTLVSIAVERLPAKLVYSRGEDFDPAGLVISGTYADGSTRTEDLNSLIFSGYDKTSLGDQTVVVSLEGKSAEFTVRVGLSALSVDITQGREEDPAVPGIPPEGILLSQSGAEELPREFILRTEGYEQVLCFVDGTELAPAGDGFLLRASDYSVNNHFITLIGIYEGVPRGRVFPFAVVD
jgi:hypothetical protein